MYELRWERTPGKRLLIRISPCESKWHYDEKGSLRPISPQRLVVLWARFPTGSMADLSPRAK